MAAPTDRSRRGWVAPVLAVVVAGVVAAVLVVGGAGSSDEASTTTTTAAAPQPVEIESDAPRYTTLDELVAASDLVVRATVTSTERGRIFGDPEDEGGTAIESRLVAVEVTDVLAGAEPPPEFYVEEEGWLLDGSPLIVDGLGPSIVGDDAIWFLVDPTDDAEEASAFVTVNGQGRYVVDGDGLVGAALRDDLITQIEGLGPDGLAEAVRQI